MSKSSCRRISTAAARVLVFGWAWVSGCQDAGSSHVQHSSTRRNERTTARAEDGGAVVAMVSDVRPSRKGSPVAEENWLPGTDNWQLRNAADRHQVEGYASTTSATAGDDIALLVNVDHEQHVRWELYRHGYYQALGGRLVATSDGTDVAPQVSCPVDPDTGMVECSWNSTFELTIEPTWVTGYYTFKLINQDGFEAEIPLVIRESGRRAPLLTQTNVNTWQAYSSWGGTSLYKNLLPAESGFTAGRASQVSFDRPYSYQNCFPPWIAAIEWVEKNGYDVAYITNVDIDNDPGLLSDRKVFLSVGHDEYVTQAERDAIVSARDQGVSLVFASANDIYANVDFKPSTSGKSLRIMHRNSHFSTRGEPESQILGNTWDNWSDQYFMPFVVTQADHWIYEGTGVRNFDVLSNVIGSEWNTVKPNAPKPAGLEVVSASPTIMTGGSPRYYANATLYYPTSDSLVFSAATQAWGLGLSATPSYDGAWGVSDPRIQRMTENVLKRAGLPPIEPTTVEPAPTITGNRIAARVIAGGGELGSAPESATLMAPLDAPAGLATGPDGQLYVADASGFVRKISADGQVSTLAGCRPSHSPDPSCLTTPIGIAVSGDGTVYFSDANNNRIYKLLQDGTLTTYAGNGDAGSADASDPLQASFSEPRGLALGAGGELYVADVKNAAIRRVDEQGVTTFARDLTGVAAIAIGSSGSVYFSSMNCQVGEIADGAVQVLACPSAINGNREGSGDFAHLRPMDGLLVDGDRLVFADTGNYRVRAVELSGDHAVSTVVGDDNASPDLDTGPHLALPRGVARYDGGYAISDSANHRILWVASTR